MQCKWEAMAEDSFCGLDLISDKTVNPLYKPSGIGWLFLLRTYLKSVLHKDTRWQKKNITIDFKTRHSLWLCGKNKI